MKNEYQNPSINQKHLGLDKNYSSKLERKYESITVNNNGKLITNPCSEVIQYLF